VTPDARDNSGWIYAAPLLLLLALGLFIAESSQLRPQIDDAFISYRYARNLVEGHGLVFNIGEYVEGYTNLLWTLLVAAAMSLGFGAVEAGHGLGFASGLAALCATALFA
jgi:arabinofuranosyltransferase